MTLNRRAIVCFDLALADVGLTHDEALRQVLHDYFAWATWTTMSRYHVSADDVPDGLRIPHWSWDFSSNKWATETTEPETTGIRARPSTRSIET